MLDGLDPLSDKNSRPWGVPSFFSVSSVTSNVTLFSLRSAVAKLSGIDEAKKKLKSTKNKDAADQLLQEQSVIAQFQDAAQVKTCFELQLRSRGR